MAAWTVGDEAARAAVLARARAFVPAVADRYPELMEEVTGIAEGADRPVEEIVALNARTELLYGDRALDAVDAAATARLRGRSLSA